LVGGGINRFLVDLILYFLRKNWQFLLMGVFGIVAQFIRSYR
jgi:hypothetical protein